MKQQDNASEKGSSSQRTCSGRVRPRLPSPVPLNISPLKSADSFVRRRKKFWTPEEVEALREGVKEYVCRVLYSIIKYSMLIHLGPNQVSK